MKNLCGRKEVSYAASGRQIGLGREPVANLGMGNKVCGRRGVVPEFLPQLAYKGTEIFQLPAVFRSPDCRQDARVGKRKSGVRHQEMKQLEFLERHVNRRARSL